MKINSVTFHDQKVKITNTPNIHPNIHYKAYLLKLPCNSCFIYPTRKRCDHTNSMSSSEPQSESNESVALSEC